MVQPYLFIASTNKMGKGVFTNQKIKAQTIIEISDVIVMNEEDRLWIDKTLLHDYIFEWGISSKQCCVALGYVSLYNHSYQANCIYEMDFEFETITIKTIQNINKGDELFINYNGKPDNTNPVWFNAV